MTQEAPESIEFYQVELANARDDRAALRAEIERLEALTAPECDIVDQLRAEIERLRAALEPFAEVASEWDGEPESLEVELRAYDDKMCPGVNVADFRAAAAALAGKEG